MPKVIMVQGTMSSAGKSLVVAGFCRIFKQDGYRVAPFKSQNMALNSFITKDGAEMGRAQVMQAEAAGIEPDVCMNPILLKPTNDSGSQVIVNGQVLGNMAAKDYFTYKPKLLPAIREAFRKLSEKADIIVIEGAGSPAEINLRDNDIVNMGMAKIADARVLLVGDIDRGGVFAQLIGTVMLLEPEEQARIKGLIVNKFRGDKKILDPGITMLEERAGKPVLGVVPYADVDIEDEDSLASSLEETHIQAEIDVAVIRFPRISNFTDMQALSMERDVSVRYVTKPSELGEPDVILLPGTKNTIQDLLWLRESGLEAAVLRLSAAGTPVLGVCGGYQMLGEQLCDPAGEESGTPCTLRGLGLLPTTTVFGTEKHLTQTAACVTTEPFAGAKLTGYEIHAGRTEVWGSAFCILADGTPEGCVQDSVFGTYLHGLFDTGELTEKLTAFLCKRKGIDPAGAELIPMEQYRQQQFDLLADGVRAALDMPAIYAAMGMQKGDNT